MVGLVKQSLYKTLGRSCLSCSELEEVILDIELALKNRPLSYVEDDVQLPILTPNVMMFIIPNHLPEEDADNMEDADLRNVQSICENTKILFGKGGRGVRKSAMRTT